MTGADAPLLICSHVARQFGRVHRRAGALRQRLLPAQRSHRPERRSCLGRGDGARHRLGGVRCRPPRLHDRSLCAGGDRTRLSRRRARARRTPRLRPGPGRRHARPASTVEGRTPGRDLSHVALVVASGGVFRHADRDALADVLVEAPGLPVEEVERQVSTRLEKLVAQIDGVETVYSMSLPGRSVVTR